MDYVNESSWKDLGEARLFIGDEKMLMRAFRKASGKKGFSSEMKKC